MRMGPVAIGILALALSGAAASWVVGAIYYVRCLSAIEGENKASLRWKALVAWPFTLGKLKGAAAEHAAVVNKAIVAFFVCLTVAVATISLSTNLNRISR
jgi:hypothetical protein